MTLRVDITHPLDGFDLRAQFEAPAGITALFGPSGSGKTTIVNAVAGLLTPQSGRIDLDQNPVLDTRAGLNLPAHKRRLGYVFQDDRLFPHLSVRRNLTYSQRFAPPSPGPSLAEVTALLGLADLQERRPATLSGGEKQRVAIGRALLSRPRMLLMDEPLAALDAPRKDEILPYLERLRDETGIPILYVSHSVAEIARLATWIVALERGQIARSGPAEDVLSDPALVRLFGLREAGAVLPATIAAHHPDGLTELAVSGGQLFLPALPQAVGTRTRVRILAQEVMLARSAPRDMSALNVLPARIVDLRSGDGPGMMVQLACGSDHILARITRRSAHSMGLAKGDRVHAVVKSVAIARSDIGGG
jgi:molybdate transport system ATP-binding protein